MGRLIIIFIIFIMVILVLVITCAPQQKAKTIANPAPEIVVGQTETGRVAKDEWQIRWDKMVQQSKREGKVVIYGAATGQIRDVLVEAFSNKFGIPVEYMAAKGPEIATRILAEMRANLYIPDVIIGAGTPSLNVLKPAGVFDPMEPFLILPEVLEPKVWWDNRIPWVDREQKYFIAFLAYTSQKVVVNADVVKPEEIKSFRDLLEPKWKGKMVMHDPTIAGSGQNFMAVMAYYSLGVDFLRQLARQEPFIGRDHRLLAEWVARGKYPIGLAIENEAVEQMRSAGIPMQFIPTVEGTHVAHGTGFLSLPKNAPHPNASALFINWLLSRQGQITYTNVARIQSARADIPTTNLDQTSLRVPGVKYVNSSTEEFQFRLPEAQELAKEIFGNLIK